MTGARHYRKKDDPTRSVEDNLQKRYESWWLGKMVVFPHWPDQTPRRVSKVIMTGPPSLVYHDVWFKFNDGSQERVDRGTGFRPKQENVTVVEETADVNTS